MKAHGEKTSNKENSNQDQTESLKYLNKMALQKVNSTLGGLFVDEKINFEKKINTIMKENTGRPLGSQNSSQTNQVRVYANSKIDKEKLFLDEKRTKDKVTINLENHIKNSNRSNLHEANLYDNKNKVEKNQRKNTESSAFKNKQETHGSETTKQKNYSSLQKIHGNKVIGLQINSNSNRMIDSNIPKKYDNILGNLQKKCQTQKNSSNRDHGFTMKNQSGLINTYQSSLTPNAVSGMFMSSNQQKHTADLNDLISQAAPTNNNKFPLNDLYKFNSERTKQKTLNKKDDTYNNQINLSQKNSSTLKRQISDMQKPKGSSTSPMKQRMNNQKNLQIDVSQSNNLTNSSDVMVNQNVAQSCRQNINFPDSKSIKSTSQTNLSLSQKQNYVDKILNNKNNFSNSNPRLPSHSPVNNENSKNVHAKDDHKDVNHSIESEKKEEKNQVERSLRESFKDHFNNKIGKFFYIIFSVFQQ